MHHTTSTSSKQAEHLLHGRVVGAPTPVDMAASGSASVKRATGGRATATTGKSGSRLRATSRVTLYIPHGSKNWHAQYQKDGQQIRRTLRTGSKKLAQQLAEKIERSLILGDDAVGSGTTVTGRPSRPVIADCVKPYLDYLQNRERSRDTVAIYERAITQFVAYMQTQGHRRWPANAVGHLQSFESALRSGGAHVPRSSPPSEPSMDTEKRASTRRRPGMGLGDRPVGARTTYNKMKVLRQWMKFLKRNGTLRPDPGEGYDLPKRPVHRTACWTPDELSRVCAAAGEPGSIERDLVEFLRCTGLRIGELSWLTADDVRLDRDRPVISIRGKRTSGPSDPSTSTAFGTTASTAKGGDDATTWKPKHGVERVVPLCPTALDIAKRRLVDPNRGSGATRLPWLFVRSAEGRRPGGQWKRNAIYRVVRRAIRSAGVGRGSPHTFRHCYCSFLANSGVSAFMVMRLMGHGSLDIVLMYYDVTEAELATAVAGVNFDAMLTTPQPRSVPSAAEAGADRTANPSSAAPAILHRNASATRRRKEVTV